MGISVSFQSGISKSIPDVSKTAPDKICEPISDPFSRTTTLSSGSICLALIAADKPAGPPPTITKS